MTVATASRIAPVGVRLGGGYFRAAGRPFLVQGCSVPRPGQVDEETLAAVASSGVTTIRIWCDLFETGELDLEGLRAVRERAEQLDVRVLLVLFGPAPLTDMYDPVSRFDRGLTAFNGVCATPLELVTSTEALDVVVARCSAIMAVFEDSPSLLGWELVNQMDDLYEATPRAMGDFVRRLAERVRAACAAYGREPLVTASSVHPAPPAWLLDVDELDFVGFHAYSESHHAPTNRVEAAVHVGAALAYALDRIAGRCPVLDVESGPIAHLYDPGTPRPPLDFRQELAHNVRWAHLAAGGAGTGLHIAINDEGQTAQRRVPRSRLAWQPLASEVADIAAVRGFWELAPGDGGVRSLMGSVSVEADDVFAFASATQTRAVGWLLRDTRSQDVAADVERALRAGPTQPSNLDLRLHALDAWRAALSTRSFDPHDEFMHRALGTLLRHGGESIRRACELVDEGLDHLLDTTRRVAPGLLEPRSVTPERVRLGISGVPDGRLTVTWFDDSGGGVVGTATATGPRAELIAPPFERHLAFVATSADARVGPAP